MTRAMRFTAILAICALVLSACGGEDSADPTPTVEPAVAAEAADAATPIPSDDASATAVPPEMPTSPDAPPTPAGGGEPESTTPPAPVPPQAEAPATESVTEPKAPQADEGEEETGEPPAEQEAEEPPAEPENPAPPLGSIDSWHNSEPLALDQLRGSPVLLVFWADY